MGGETLTTVSTPSSEITTGWAMRQDDNSGDDIFRIDETERPAWLAVGDVWSWLFPVLGFCAFEWFANPGISVAVACLKFGYTDFRTAWWLRGDRRAGRGDIHALFYFARGCFVTALWSVFFSVLFGLLEQAIIRNNPFDVVEDLFISTLLVTVIGFCLGALAAGWGFKLVVEQQRNIWMDSTIHQARRERRWTSVCQGHRNEFPRFCLGILIVSLLWLTGAAVGFVALFNDPQHAPNDPFWQRVFGCLIAFVIAGIPAVAIIVVSLKAWRLAARSADSVWSAN